MDNQKRTPPRPRIVQAEKRQSRPWGVIVVLGLLLVGAFFVWDRVSTKRGVTLMEPGTFMTNTAQRSTYELSNGVEVTLAPQSELRVREEFVELAGEAFFTIPPEMPFQVKVPSILGRDSGTQIFIHNVGGAINVRKYPEDTLIRLAVRAGSPTVAANDPEAAGAPVAEGSVVLVDQNGVPKSSSASVDGIFSWAEGTLTLDQVPLNQALRDLSRWFGVNFVVQDTVAAKRPVSLKVGLRDRTPDVERALQGNAGLQTRQQNSGKTVVVSMK